MSGGKNQPADPLVEPLTRRERDILALLAQEHSAPEIAQSLTLAVSSVKWYIQQVYGKLGVNSRRQAITRARELGLVEAPSLATPAAPAAQPPVTSVPPAVSPPPTPERKHNLPVQVTRFFGREDEIRHLKQRLADNRLVTLTGSGGVGKTRLSLLAAEELLDQFSDGVWLVELAPLTDPALVPQHLAAALGAREQPDRSPLENLLVFLRGRRLLLVLDNCEHLLQACARLVETLLRDSPGLKVLASSREPLGIAGEAVFGVPSLPYPDPAHLPPTEELGQYEAINLFVDRARLLLPDYAIGPHNAAALARICQRLDGIPLAIEMAAARVNMHSASKVAERLDDAFRVLTGGSRTALPRQQTLRAMIDWSYDLLSNEERRLLQRLSVFAGGCTLEAAEVICADNAEAELEPAAPLLGGSEIVDLLASLVSKSMVVAARSPGHEARYTLLETVRQYAREKLQAAGEGDRLRARHLHFFLRLAQEAEPELRGPDQIAWLNQLETELDNLRAAMDYSQAAGTSAAAEAGLRIAVELGVFWYLRGHWREAGAWVEAALARHNVPERSLVRAEALTMGNDLALARSRAEESVEIFREAGTPARRGLAYALITLGGIRHGQADFGPKLTLFEESAALFRELGDKWGLAFALHTLANTLDPLVNYEPRGEANAPAPLPHLEPAARNDHTAEHALFEESLALFRELGDRWAQASVLDSMGHTYFCWGKLEAARAIYNELIQIWREFGVEGAVAYALIHLGRDALAQDELDQAAMYCEKSLSVLRDMEDDWGTGLVNMILAERARRLGDYERSARLLSGAMDYYQKLGNNQFVAAVLDFQGRMARSQGNHSAAHALHLQALVRRREAGHPIDLAHSFHALALLAERDGRTERAARLFGAAQPYHAAMYHFWVQAPIWRAEHERAVAAVCAQLGEASAAALIAEGEAMTLEQAYACALES
jgi:predicted ATPase/DNA-binding CsgD family transcriptional regulator